jgi:hypothetical protein
MPCFERMQPSFLARAVADLTRRPLVLDMKTAYGLLHGSRNVLVRPMIKLSLISVALTVVVCPAQRLLADQLSTAKDVSIIVVRRPDGRELGNVKVTFSDGHTEVLTHTGDCYNAKLSSKGNVGWIRVGKSEKVPGPRRMIQVGNDSLVVRFPDGTIKKFAPVSGKVDVGDWRGIMDWRFGDDDKTLIVRSMGHHGPSSYVQYDLASGKMIDSRGPGYTPYAELPVWAKPLATPDE